jgi:DNA mismatch repair protein MutL
MAIQRLDKHLTQKIAAGEVVDRPASVIKELLENALDAQSESIDVWTVDGGKSLISVRDDGFGMSSSDLTLAVERYATSKISREEDLYDITTMGFRGEALASIAAVSRLQIKTCDAEEDGAHELIAEQGRILEIRPTARPRGTTVQVRDLFYNLPARQAFLGSDRTETLHINRMVHRLALLRPEVGWKVRHGDRDVLEAPRVASPLDRIAQIYGPDVAEAMIPIDLTRDHIEVAGYISRPDLRRGTRRDQLFAVNGRAVFDRGLSFLLSSAYRGILRSGSFPIACVTLRVPLSEVDVNVHPRKEEVRFSHPRQVQDAVSAALQRALSSRSVVGSLAPRSGSAVERSAAPTSAMPSQGAHPAQNQMRLDLAREIQRSRDLQAAEKVSLAGAARVLGQIHNTYLVVETPDGLDLVDQHIAHERILFERLQREWPSGIARQIFLLPARIELSFEQATVVSSYLDELAEIGVVMDDFGGGTFLLREFPQVLAVDQSLRGFDELIEALVDVLSERGDTSETLYARLFSQLACSAAIKAGEPLPLVEAQALVDELMTMENPYACPHGRPVIISYSKEALDKRFRRA